MTNQTTTKAIIAKKIPKFKRELLVKAANQGVCKEALLLIATVIPLLWMIFGLITLFTIWLPM